MKKGRYIFMTVDAYAKRCSTTRRTVNQWIQKGFVPGADLEHDYVPDSAKPPYTGTRVNGNHPKSIFSSIMKATLSGKHVFPELYKMCPEEFNSYISQLVEAGLIRVRITDSITYYDPTIKAEQESKAGIQELIKGCVEAASKGVTSAYLEMAKA